MSDRTNGQGVLRLSLNGPAQERLLGGDSELETELRLNIAKQFTKDHLAPMFNTDAMKEVTKALQASMERAIAERIGTSTDSWSSKKFTLVPEFKAKLDEKVDEIIGEYIKGLNLENRFEAVVNASFAKWTSYADAAVKKHLEVEIERRIEDGIRTRLAIAARASK